MKLVIQILLFAFTASASSAVDRVEVPSTLHAAIGGDIWGPSYNVYFQDSLLHYTVTDSRRSTTPTTTAAVSPSPEQWVAFRKALDTCAVWSWQRRYNSAALDQAYWTVTIIYRGKKVQSEGYGQFPPNFEKFCEAVRNLLGRKDLKFQ